MSERTIVDSVLEFAIQNPEKVAIVDSEGSHTYGRLAQALQKIAYYFEAENLKHGSRVLVECTQDFRYLACGLACHLTGMVFVPIEHNASVQRIDAIAKNLEADLFISDNAVLEEIKTVLISGIVEWKLNVIGGEFAGADKWGMQLPETLAEILYTTGTTGKPKGIMISNQNNIAIAENIIYGTQMKKDNVELVPMPLSHSHGLRTCYANLLNGSTVVLFDGVMNVQKIYEAIKEFEVSAIDLSPSAAKVLLKISKGMFKDISNQIDYVELGTAVLDEDTKMALKQTFPTSRLYNFYGSTEAGRSCILNFSSEDDVPYCIGYPARNARFIIADETKRECKSSSDNPGLLAVSGKMNMLGYWNDSVTVKNTMVNGYIYTSDLAYIDDKGRIFVLGRADDVINYKGIKISPEEIETPVQKYKGVVDCACVAMKDKMCGQVPHLYIQVVNKDNFDLTAFTEYLKTILSIERVPKRIDFIEKIPRTSNGKLQRKVLNNE